MLWQRLKTISRIKFESQSCHADNRWRASGGGRVVVECRGDRRITFSETGSWTADSGLSLDFSNRYRWHRTTSEDIIRLQHLRHGETRPVELVEFMLQPDLSWQSRSPHICNGDTYRAEITLRESGLSLKWTISGSAKSEWICCTYS